MSPKVLTPEIRALRLPVLSLPEWEMKIARDPLGMEIARRMPGGVVAIWKRDPLGRPALRHVLANGFTTTGAIVSSSAIQLATRRHAPSIEKTSSWVS